MRAAAEDRRGWPARLRAALWITGTALLAGCSLVPTIKTPRGPVAALAVNQADARQAISAYRRAHGLAQVELDPALERVAQRQALAMASADELSHTVAGALPARLADGGADRSAAVENVSAGYRSLDSAIAGWRRSPAHKANLLFGPMRRMGIAAASAPDTRFKTFWSLVMTN